MVFGIPSFGNSRYFFKFIYYFAVFFVNFFTRRLQEVIIQKVIILNNFGRNITSGSGWNHRPGHRPADGNGW